MNAEEMYSDLIITFKKLINRINEYETKTKIINCKPENEEYRESIINRLNSSKYRILGESIKIISTPPELWNDLMLLNTFDIFYNDMIDLKKFYDDEFESLESIILIIEGILQE